jgi:outer membrane receptor for monomeric catechols
MLEFNITQNIKIRLSQEEFKDTKGVIRIRKSKKNRKHNGKRKSTKG